MKITITETDKDGFERSHSFVLPTEDAEELKETAEAQGVDLAELLYLKAMDRDHVGGVNGY